MKTPITALFVLAFAASTLTMAGCYTMLRNPHGDFLEEPARVDSECASCHSDADYYHYWIDPSYAYTLYPAPWTIYYDQVWWYAPYGHGADEDDEKWQIADGGRHSWDRGPGSISTLPRRGGGSIGGSSPPPPRVTDSPGPATPDVTPSGPGPRPIGPHVTPPSTPDPKPAPEPDRSSSDRDRENGKSKKRSSWGR